MARYGNHRYGQGLVMGVPGGVPVLPPRVHSIRQSVYENSPYDDVAYVNREPYSPPFPPPSIPAPPPPFAHRESDYYNTGSENRAPVTSDHGRPQAKDGRTNEGTVGEELKNGIMEAVAGTDINVEGDTVEDPPDGGTRAWLIVLACALINACNEVIYYMFLSTGFIPLVVQVQGGTPERVYSDPQVFEDVRLIGEPIAALLAIAIGYRIVAIAGGALLAAGFLIASFLNPEDVHVGVFHFLIGVVAGLGSSFWKLATIVAVLEYFKKNRMKAIILAGIGRIVGMFAGYGTLIAPLKPIFDDKDESTPDWRDYYRFILIPVGVGTIAGATLTPLKLMMADSKEQTFVQRALGLTDWALFKFIPLWLVLGVYFCYYLGEAIPESSIIILLATKKFSINNILASVFIIVCGGFLGYILLACWRKKKFTQTLMVMGPVCLFIGILSLQAPAFAPDYFLWIAVYLIIYGTARTVFESVLQDVVPLAFGRQNIRLIEGLLGLAGGIGTSISNPSAEDIIKHQGEYDNQYYLAGSAFLGAGLLAVVSANLLQRNIDYRDEDLEEEVDENVVDNAVSNSNNWKFGDQKTENESQLSQHKPKRGRPSGRYDNAEQRDESRGSSRRGGWNYNLSESDDRRSGRYGQSIPYYANYDSYDQRDLYYNTQMQY